MTTAVYLGRFQPLHKGHLSILSEIERKYDRLIIILGSPTNRITCTNRNPLTTRERRKLIKQALSGFRIPWRIISQRDVGINSVWKKQILRKTPIEALVISGNPLVLRILRNNRKVKRAVFKVSVHGTKIRALAKRGDLRWRRMVAPSTLRLLDSMHFEYKVANAKN